MTWSKTYTVAQICHHRKLIGLASAAKAASVLLSGSGHDPEAGTVTLEFFTQPTDQVMAAVDAVVVAHTDPLACAKVQRNAAIDKQTHRLIVAGFTYDGKTFSASPAGQRTVAGYHDAQNALTYPVIHSTIDDLDAATLNNAADANAIYEAMAAHVGGHRSSGSALKLQVAAATTVAAVEAIQDTR